ncbi:MAG: response regulator transcription factor [Lutibacter sp.]|uniref:LytR/AlgR family response regulator transcription factor n=1 Tax=Lutibacter sp. TaxID=1925666 RepID=UPI00185D42C7|nr:LytTR family DNA-binding domain-containing protein [Lutibacter sp.]MBT8317786.1 LytTR family DNA-binding domain-containing protein [Lutibacter sp.]NNJ58644.1 response regulator transcription factor [Lutibacter sp.]
MTINAILIDDERKALAILKNKLDRLCPNIKVVAETQSPKEGIGLIKKLRPQLVFLDIAMPEMSGFDLLSQIEKPNFEIIFATAFDNYAIEAINNCAIGYLVKPIDNQDLVITVNKAIQNIEDKTALEKNKLLIENLGVQKFQNKKIVIPSQDGLEFVKINEILHCEGTDGYTTIHFKARKSILSSNSIGHFNKLLESQHFYLVHKSHLINLDHIEKYFNEGYVLLSDNSKIPVSRNKRQGFLNSFK